MACLILQTGAKAAVEPSATALVESVAAKLQSAKTLRLTATHTMDPALGVGSRLEKGPLEITVKRPNQIHVLQRAGTETRELVFDGKTVCVMQPQMKHHALEPLKAGTIEQFADRMDERFGFRPPVAELLSEDMAAQLMLHVTSARIVGTGRVGWTRCRHLRFEQPGMTGELWISEKDNLPLRYQLTFTGIKGSPKWDIRLSNWELNVPVDDRLFSKRPSADSAKLQMLKSR
jgi:hypothetical protein